MAKISFNKLVKKINIPVEEFEFNEQKIEVKQYLPIEDKLNLIADTIMAANQGERYNNYLREQLYLSIGIIEKYTNINFTDKQKEDIDKTYDMLITSGLGDKIFSLIPEEELDILDEGLEALSESIYKQMNSVYGIIEGISNDYKDIGEKTDEIQNALSNPNNLAFLKDIMNKLG